MGTNTQTKTKMSNNNDTEGSAPSDVPQAVMGGQFGLTAGQARQLWLSLLLIGILTAMMVLTAWRELPNDSFSLLFNFALSFTLITPVEAYLVLMATAQERAKVCKIVAYYCGVTTLLLIAAAVVLIVEGVALDNTDCLRCDANDSDSGSTSTTTTASTPSSTPDTAASETLCVRIDPCPDGMPNYFTAFFMFVIACVVTWHGIITYRFGTRWVEQ